MKRPVETQRLGVEHRAGGEGGLERAMACGPVSVLGFQGPLAPLRHPILYLTAQAFV